MTDKEKINDLEDRIEVLEKELAKYKGFIGGIIFIGSCLWAVVTFALEFLKRGN